MGKIANKEKNFIYLKNNKGITLIALVITIIVMLILVAVTINMAINGGLFSQAGKATGDTKNAINAEQELANGKIQIGDKVYNSIDDYLAGIESSNPEEGETPGDQNQGGDNETIEGIDREKFSAIYQENKAYTDKNGKTTIIPKGFAVGTSEGINTIDEGLVIQDKDGNQFVWIPVANIANFQRKAWIYEEEDWSEYSEPFEDGYDGEQEEYNTMKKSVEDNKGFYIGRFEAGTTTPRTYHDEENGTTDVVVKRDMYPYNYVGWGASMTDYTSEIDNEGLGALKLSKNLYDGKDVGVTSTLCYGVQWDAMLDFIKDSTHNVTETDSTSWGNHVNSAWTINRATAKWLNPNEGMDWTTVETNAKTKTDEEKILLTTGASDNFKEKNIYDIAGNLDEWTNEAYSTYNRVIRGGSFYDGGGGSVAYRNCLYTSNVTYEIRNRV